MHEIREIRLCGDSALLVCFEDRIAPEINRKVTALFGCLKDSEIPGILDMVPAYSSLMINYDPLRISSKELEEKIRHISLPSDTQAVLQERIVTIPVLYGVPFADDVQAVTDHTGLSFEEIVRIHTSADYRVYMMGFLPGFPYLGDLDPRLHTPRRSVPRARIPAGSVGIGGAQTGIYSMDSPGGWHIIGRTPICLYDPSADNPVLLRGGDILRFVSVSEEEYLAMEKEGRSLCL